MNTLEDAFTKLLGRQPSDREKQDLYRTRDALNLKNNDALWLLLIALGHYETAYARFPALIASAAADLGEKAKSLADAEFKAAAARARTDLARTVAKTAHDMAGRAASANRLQWIVVCVVVAALAFLLVGVLSYRAGDKTGYTSGAATGYAQARNEQAAAAWANTPEGQFAYAFAKAGGIRDLAACSGRGHTRKGDTCFAKSENGSVWTWRLPPQVGQQRRTP